MSHFYCTAYSLDYAYQGMVLYKSLVEHDCNFKLFIICLDNSVMQLLHELDYKDVVLISVHDIEESYRGLAAVKEQRKTNEYVWTLKPSILLYILKNFQYVDHIIWLDGDMKFFSDPKPIYNEWGRFSILFTHQYYTGPYEYLVSTYGKYQAGFIGFKRELSSFMCLKWWQKKCIEWCHDKPDSGRWADQKYLDLCTEKFKRIKVANNLGINMTPFTIYRFNTEKNKVVAKNGDELYINDIKLILYHYYGFRCYKDRKYDLCCYWMKFTDETIENIYVPYLDECEEAINVIKKHTDNQYELASIDENSAMNYYSIVPPPINTSS